jgi:hypothetical protein
MDATLGTTAVPRYQIIESTTELAAIVAVVLLGAVTLFQLALVLGAPWGAAAWGGQHPGVLPTRLRVASAVTAIVVYPIIIAIILASAQLASIDWLPVKGAAPMWVLAALFVLGAVMNAVSRSRIERIWGPVTLVIAIGCGIVAISS